MKMNQIMKMLGLSLLLSMGASAFADTLLVKDSKRTVTIDKEITGDVLLQAQKVVELAAISKEPIYIVLNSPGGSVMAGNIFISAVHLAQERGITVVGVSTVMAASMAFNILTECNERYVLENTLLLFHPVGTMIMGVVKAQEAGKLAEDMDKLDQHELAILDKALNMDKAEIRENYYAEHMWTGEELNLATHGKFLHVVKDIKGLKQVFLSEEQQQKAEATKAQIRLNQAEVIKRASSPAYQNHK